MEGKSETEKSSRFRIVDLLQCKEEHDMPMELTCKTQVSPAVSSHENLSTANVRHVRESNSPPKIVSKPQNRPQLSSCPQVPSCSSPESPEPYGKGMNVTPPVYPVLHLHHPAYPFHAHHHFPHLGSTFPRMFGIGMESPMMGNIPLTFETGGAGSVGQLHRNHGHHHHPSSILTSSPITSPTVTNPFLHTHGIHVRPNHLSPEFSLWQGNETSGASGSPNGGSSLISSYPDPRLYEYAYPASTLLSRIACGMDYMGGRGLHPLLHGESKRKGGQIRFSNSQTSQLEKAFVEHKYQNAHERRKLAHSLGLTDRQVKTWFQNRRAKWRKIGHKGDDQSSEKKSHHHHPSGYSDNLRLALLDRSSSSSSNSTEKSLIRHE